MNYRERFIEITSFLRPLAPMWQDEILNSYPLSMDNYPKEWIDTLLSLNEEELYNLDILGKLAPISETSLAHWLRKAKEISFIDGPVQKEVFPELPPYAFHKVKAKKQYEINIIGSFIKSLPNDETPEHLIDIGGGVGHLARVMAHYYGLNTTSIDCNEEFQKIGQERLIRYPAPNGAKELTYVNLLFGPDGDDDKLASLFTPQTLSLGLHTCGPLALAHFRTNFKYKTKALLNFGCCYAKMNPKRDINLSTLAKEIGLPFSEFTLALASRGHTSMDMRDFRLKRKVKNYRYALHFFLQTHFSGKFYSSVGEVLTKEYWGPFSDYVRGRLENLNLSHDHFSDEQINSFFENDQIQYELNRIFMANIIRWQLGRVCEIYLLLDRCLYLEENNHKVIMREFFSDEVSPRNIGLYAKRF